MNSVYVLVAIRNHHTDIVESVFEREVHATETFACEDGWISALFQKSFHGSGMVVTCSQTQCRVLEEKFADIRTRMKSIVRDECGMSSRYYASRKLVARTTV